MKFHHLLLPLVMAAAPSVFASEDFDIYSVDPEAYQPLTMPESSLFPTPRSAGDTQDSAIMYDLRNNTSIELKADPNAHASPESPGQGSTTWLDPDNRNFSDYSKAGGLTSFPRSPNVKVLFTKDSGNFYCSGSLIGRNMVLTAANCVYDYDNQKPNTKFVVIPAYDYYGTSPEPFGRIGSTNVTWWTGYANNRDFSYNFGLITLDEPIGDRTGWYGFHSNSDCGFFQGNTFHSFSYPGDTYMGRQMQYRKGTFDDCINPSGASSPYPMARLNTPAIGGGGSTAYDITSDNQRIVYAVLSAGSSNYTYFARLTSTTASLMKQAKDKAEQELDDPFQINPGPITPTPGQVPSAPILSALTINGLTVSGYWSASNATGYRLWFKDGKSGDPDGGGYAVVDMGSNTSASYTLFDGASFFVRITAYNATGESPPSNIQWFVLGVGDNEIN